MAGGLEERRGRATATHDDLDRDLEARPQLVRQSLDLLLAAGGELLRRRHREGVRHGRRRPREEGEVTAPNAVGIDDDTTESADAPHRADDDASATADVLIAMFKVLDDSANAETAQQNDEK